MVRDACVRYAGFVPRYGENPYMTFVEAIAMFLKIQSPKLGELTRDSVRGYLEDHVDYKSQVAQVARGSISMVPAGVLKLLDIIHSKLCETYVAEDHQ